MKPESRKYLHDICHAADSIARFTEGKTFTDYSEDEMLRSAVERQFEIIGEAVNRLARIDAETVSHIDAYRRVIAFRNILIHGYAQVDRRIVWGLIEAMLPTLNRQARILLGDD